MAQVLAISALMLYGIIFSAWGVREYRAARQVPYRHARSLLTLLVLSFTVVIGGNFLLYFLTGNLPFAPGRKLANLNALQVMLFCQLLGLLGIIVYFFGKARAKRGG